MDRRGADALDRVCAHQLDHGQRVYFVCGGEAVDGSGLLRGTRGIPYGLLRPRAFIDASGPRETLQGFFDRVTRELQALGQLLDRPEIAWLSAQDEQNLELLVALDVVAEERAHVGTE